ncbi:hypothetical protein L1887_32799 [Cichorium endivia]|nr:hypothetical protein L1887_32799 [Cichorium endivia]
MGRWGIVSKICPLLVYDGDSWWWRVCGGESGSGQGLSATIIRLSRSPPELKISSEISFETYRLATEHATNAAACLTLPPIFWFFFHCLTLPPLFYIAPTSLSHCRKRLKSPKPAKTGPEPANVKGGASGRCRRWPGVPVDVVGGEMGACSLNKGIGPKLPINGIWFFGAGNGNNLVRVDEGGGCGLPDVKDSTKKFGPTNYETKSGSATVLLTTTSRSPVSSPIVVECDPPNEESSTVKVAESQS